LENTIIKYFNDFIYFDFLIFFFVFIILFFSRGIFAKFILSRVKKILKRYVNNVTDHHIKGLESPLKLFPIILLFIYASFYINNETQFGVYLAKFINSLFTLFVFWFIHQSLSPLSKIFFNLEKLISKALLAWFTRSLKYLVIFLALVSILEIWGIKIGPIIAGLGLFGVAVALGSQDLFKNLISGILIIMERSFEIDDIIEVPGKALGTVEHIGFRSTLIRQFDTTVISLPNYVFSDSAIINFSKRKYRRIKWTVGLVYETSTDQLRNICSDIKNYIKSSENFIINTEFQLFVRVDKFNDSSIDLLLQTFTNTKDWNKYLLIKEELAYNLKKIIEKNSSSFAFPTSTIYIEKNN
jgi:MscS family membrane protein